MDKQRETLGLRMWSLLIRNLIELQLNCVYRSEIYYINLIACLVHEPFSKLVVLCWSVGDSESHITPNTNAIIHRPDLWNPITTPPKLDKNTFTQWRIVFTITTTRKQHFTKCLCQKGSFSAQVSTAHSIRIFAWALSGQIELTECPNKQLGRL